MIITVHCIRNYSANVINRGEDGEPKSMTFGGKKRTRISSQARKNKWRKTLREDLSDLTGTRTRHIGELVRDMLIKESYSERVALRAGIEITRYLSSKKEKKDIKMEKDELIADTIRAYSKKDINHILDFVKAELAKEETAKKIGNVEADKKVSALLDTSILDSTLEWPIPIDTALFGRMVASDPALNVPASVYVAHAFSTHASMDDVDFFVATDDLAKGLQETGAGHMGNISFDTTCMYECAYIDTEILSDNLKDIENKEEVIKQTIKTLIPAMIFESPDGKQTTMMSRPVPSAVLIEVQGNKIVYDYANAFADAVWKDPIVKESVLKLRDECAKDDKMYGDYRDITKRLWLTSFDDIDMENATKVESLSDMVTEIVESL